MAIIMECRMHQVFFGEYLSMKNPKGKQRELRCCAKCLDRIWNKLAIKELSV